MGLKEDFLKIWNSIVGNRLVESHKNKQIVIDDDTDEAYIKLNEMIYKFDGYRKIKYNNSTGKIFVYSLHKLDLDTCKSKFTVREYMEIRGIKDRKSLNKQVDNDLDALKSVSGVSHSQKGSYGFNHIVIYGKRENGIIYVTFNQEFVDLLKKHYLHIPKQLLSIKDNRYPNAWSLGYYIYEHSRINCSMEFNLNIKTCLARTNIQSYESIKEKNDRHFDKLMITPFLLALQALNTYIPDLEIKVSDYNTIEDFLNAKVSIKITNEDLKNANEEIKYLRSLKNNRNMDENIKMKPIRKTKANEYKKEGKNVIEISKLIGVTPKTVRTYLQEG